MKNFEFTGETKKNDFGVTLQRIRCTVAIDKHGVKVGDLGGWIENEENLIGNAWVYGDAQVYGDARVYGDAWVSCDARVYGDAQVSGDARVYGYAQVKKARDICWFSVFGSRNATTTAYLTKTGVEITCGCFRGTLIEFIEKVKETHKGTEYESEYLAICEVIKIRFKL